MKDLRDLNDLTTQDLKPVNSLHGGGGMATVLVSLQGFFFFFPKM